MRTINHFTIAIAVSMCLPLYAPVLASDKPTTTYQHQVNLMKEVNAGQKSKQLTVKQAKHLRKDLSNIAVHKQNSRDKNEGKIAGEDQSKIEEKLSKTGDKIKKLKEENARDAR